MFLVVKKLPVQNRTMWHREFSYAVHNSRIFQFVMEQVKLQSQWKALPSVFSVQSVQHLKLRHSLFSCYFWNLSHKINVNNLCNFELVSGMSTYRQAI
jgi:hypothetical protein